MENSWVSILMLHCKYNLQCIVVYLEVIVVRLIQSNNLMALFCLNEWNKCCKIEKCISSVRLDMWHASERIFIFQLLRISPLTFIIN